MRAIVRDAGRRGAHRGSGVDVSSGKRGSWSPRELYEAPRRSFVAGFRGDANRVKGSPRRIDGTLGEVRIGALLARIRELADGEVDVAIRPESLRLAPAGSEALAATVSKAAYLGGTMEYTLATPVGELFVITNGRIATATRRGGRPYACPARRRRRSTGLIPARNHPMRDKRRQQSA